MGERKGTNLYYPPDYDPRKGGLNKWQGTHALRERAKKLHLGILIIRFEMPYNIWCEGCGNHVGMGVRYNAEKKKVGMYYTTPIYQFRMKCHLCDNHFEIKTDPANLDYEIMSGARRQEKRFRAEDNGTVIPDEKSTINKLTTDGMYKLEHGEMDKEKGRSTKPTIGKIFEIQNRVRDDYSANRTLRDAMRVKRKAANKQKKLDEELLKKSSLGINLLPENESDSRTASLLRLCAAVTPEERQSRQRERILEGESIFDGGGPRKTSSGKDAKPDRITDFEDLGSVAKRKSGAEGFNFSTKSLGIKRRSSEAVGKLPSPSKLPKSPSTGATKDSLSLVSCDYGSTTTSSDSD